MTIARIWYSRASATTRGRPWIVELDGRQLEASGVVMSVPARLVYERGGPTEAWVEVTGVVDFNATTGEVRIDAE